MRGTLDENGQRWLLHNLIASLPLCPFYQMIAVSQTSILQALVSLSVRIQHMPDYPKFGIWTDGYYMSANVSGRKRMEETCLRL